MLTRTQAITLAHSAVAKYREYAERAGRPRAKAAADAAADAVAEEWGRLCHEAAVERGRMTSDAKRVSSAENGKKGGRPRKPPKPMPPGTGEPLANNNPFSDWIG